MSALISRIANDSFSTIQREHKTSAVNDQNDSDLSFAKALKILTGNSSTSGNELFVQDDLNEQEFVFGPLETKQPYADNGSEAQECEESSEIADRFAVLNGTPSSSEWKVLNQGASAEDYSILGKLGDGLMTAAKFAAGAYLGNVI